MVYTEGDRQMLSKILGMALISLAVLIFIVRKDIIR